MPLNEASWAVVVICDRMPLNWLTRLLRTVCADASTTGAVGVVKLIAVVSVPPIAPPDATEPSVDEANSLVVVIVSLPVEFDRRGQVVGQQRGIELVQRLDRAVGTVAEGDVDRGAAIEGGKGQGLAGEAAGRRGATRGEVGARSGVAGEAERRERVAGADDRQIGVRAGRDLQRAAGVDRRRSSARWRLPTSHRRPQASPSERRWQDRSPSARRRLWRPADRPSSCRYRRSRACR